MYNDKILETLVAAFNSREPADRVVDAGAPVFFTCQVIRRGGQLVVIPNTLDKLRPSDVKIATDAVYTWVGPLSEPVTATPAMFARLTAATPIPTSTTIQANVVVGRNQPSNNMYSENSRYIVEFGDRGGWNGIPVWINEENGQLIPRAAIVLQWQEHEYSTPIEISTITFNPHEAERGQQYPTTRRFVEIPVNGKVDVFIRPVGSAYDWNYDVSYSSAWIKISRIQEPDGTEHLLYSTQHEEELLVPDDDNGVLPIPGDQDPLYTFHTSYSTVDIFNS